MSIKSSQILVQEALKEIKTINVDEAFDLVYTDNYYAENPLFMNLKNRSFAFKINYWLNI